MKKPPPAAIRLRGVRYASSVAIPPKVWLNSKLLSLNKSLKIKSHNIYGFGWGSDARGAAQLALAICAELYPKAVSVQAAPSFRAMFLDEIKSENFDVTLSLDAFNRDIISQIILD